MLRRFFNKWLTGKQKLAPSSTTISSIATQYSIDRRDNFRINYPESGHLQLLPSVTVAGNPVRAFNISKGGVCLCANTGLFNDEIGNNFDLCLNWQDEQIVQKSQIVGISLNKRHIQFINPSPSVQDRIERLIGAAYLGSKMRLIDTDPTSAVEWRVTELFISPTDESISIYHSKHNSEILAEIYFEKKQIQILRHGQVLVKPPLEIIQRKNLIGECAVMLVNLKNITPAARLCCEMLERDLKLGPQ